MFFEHTEQLIKDTTELSEMYEDDIFLSIDIINELKNTDFNFDEDEKNNILAFLENGKIKKAFNYNYDICLLNNKIFARYEALKGAWEYVNEWYQSQCN